MNEKLEMQLVTKYPKIFRDYKGDIHKTCLYFGLECGSGWYGLIDRLCKRITELDPEGNCYAVQVKEKFGGLRFYISGGTDDIYDVLEAAEEESYKICEDCGEPGTAKSLNNWISTLCDTCRSSNENRI